MNATEHRAHIFLTAVRATTVRIKELDKLIEYQRGLVQTKDLTAERVQTSGVGNPTEQRAFKVLSLREELEDMKIELMEYQVTVQRVIGAAGLTAVEDTAISMHYLCEGRPPTWEQIAKELNYSDRQIYNIRNEALRKIAEALRNVALNCSAGVL